MNDATATQTGVDEMEKMFSEWFWSEHAANRAAERLEKKGYICKVRYAMDASGRSDWLLTAY